jgi:hypothetical protein
LTIPHPKSPLRLDYIGGLPGADRERKNVSARIDAEGIHLSDPGAMLRWEQELAWESVREFAVEGSDQVQQRVTVTRLLAVGIFAFAWRKKERSAFLVLDIGDGEVILASRNHTIHQLRTELRSLLATSAEHLRDPQAATSAPAPSTPAKRIRQLQELLDQGLIGQDGFDAKRQAIINEL